MSDVVIVSAVRTPIGTFNGGLASLSGADLGKVAISAALERGGLTAADVSEVVMGQVLTAGSGQNPARQAMIKGGLPKETPAFTINKVCGSGMKAVLLACQAIKAGDAEIIVAVGMYAEFAFGSGRGEPNGP